MDQMVQESQSQLAAIINSAMDAIITVEADQRIRLFNPAAEKMFQRSASDVIGKPLTILIPKRLRAKHEDDLLNFGKTSITKRSMGRLGMVYGLRANGEEFPLEVSISQANFDGKKTFTAILRDITERKQIEAQLRESEQRFRAMADSAPAMIWVSGVDKSRTWFNRGWLEFVGRSMDQELGNGWTENIHPDDFERCLHSYATAFDARQPFDVEYRLRRYDGAWRWILDNGAPRFDPNQEFSGYIGSCIDITERKLAEERFRLMVEAAPSAVILVNQGGKIVLVNNLVQRLFGYEREELLGCSVEMLVPKRFRHSHPDYRADFYTAPQARPMGAGRDLFGLRKDGREVPVEIGLAPLETSDGAVVLVSIIDISERKRAEYEIKQTLENLTRSNQELEQFAYVASHDLQEPLRMVSSYVQLIARRYQGRLDDDADEFIDFAVEGTNRMKVLINDLLVFSRVGTRGKEFAPVALERVFEIVVNDLQLSIQENNLALTRDPLPQVLADDGQMVQLFENLLGNAIKFRGPAKPRVHVGAKRQGDKWLLSVRDNGIGIDPQFAERIFIIFQRLHTRKEYPGTGIGLAICRKIVERHGGRIWVESEPERGAIFYFTLPALGADTPIDEEEDFPAEAQKRHRDGIVERASDLI